MSWVRIYVHMVFSTKNREPFLQSPELRNKVFKHIKEHAEKKDIRLECVNGYVDHVHCLLSLGSNQMVSEVAHLIKGESAFWINKKRLVDERFNWQDDYWAVGVSESHVEAVRNYIHNQEVHHLNKLFVDEMCEFMARCKLNKIKIGEEVRV